MATVDAVGITTDMQGLPRSVGRKLGPTDWTEMTQTLVNDFAELTGDRNFIHVDPKRAAATPFGGTIAHGFLSLSLLSPVTQLLGVSDAGTAINYGVNKVRFPAPLKVGARFRGAAEVTAVLEINGGVEVHLTATMEVENSDRPAVVAESVVRFYA